jgi:hypothetical protein
MTRVLAAFVKSAVNTAASKQVVSAGLHVNSCAVTFQGKTAYAVWRRQRPYSAGNRCDKPAVKYRINYPAMPDDALLTRKEADLIAAYTLHETGHVIYTPNNLDFDRRSLGLSFKNPDQRLHMLANGFEDARMEAVVIRYGARNARNLFVALVTKLTAGITADWNPCDLANAPFTIALLGREALGNGNTFTSQLLSRIPEPQRSIYAAAVDWFADAPDGYDKGYWSYRVADAFLILWDAMRKDQGKQPPPSQPQYEADDEGDEGEDLVPDDGEGEEQDEEAGNPAPYELDDDTPEAEGKDSGPADDFGDDEDGEDEEKEEGKDEQGGSEDAGIEPDEDAPKDESSPFADTTQDGGEFKSPEPTLDDMFKRINKRTDSNLDIKMSAFCAASRDVDMMDYLSGRGFK